ncbi:MAG: molybdopterin molybdotransferase MoeA [Chloroflexi bacterium]|nr:molybdopterin molybdotransferase MoeA [Chloroflexota bacterium]
MADRLMSADEALAAIFAAVPKPTEPEWVQLADALGRVAAEDVRSAIDLPPWDNSAMDGYALRHADVADATDQTPVPITVIGDVAAGGAPDASVGRGTAVRIATGARIPDGADSVVPVEETTPTAADGTALGPRGRDAADPLPPAILVHTRVPLGGSIRRRASDLQSGTLVLRAGTTVGRASVAIVAGAGHAALSVHRRPIVGILATGDEIRAPGAELGVSGIPDSNGPALFASVQDAGGEGRSLGIARDRIEEVRSRLSAGLAESPDAIIVSGGVSVGPYDHVRTAFSELGSISFWRAAVQPGKPFVFGTAPRPGGGVPVLLFGLPGNPVSTFVTFELFVRPALRRLGGHLDHGRPVDRAVLLDQTPKSPGRRAFVRVRADRDDRGTPVRNGEGRVIVRLVGGVSGQGSHVLSALAEAEALAVIPEGVDVHPAGGEVDIWWLGCP